MTGTVPSTWRHSLYYHYYEKGEHHVPRHEGVRTERYKLVHFYDADQWDLYDLVQDPHEMRSVYDDPAYRGIANRLKAELEALRKKYGVDPA